MDVKKLYQNRFLSSSHLKEREEENLRKRQEIWNVLCASFFDAYLEDVDTLLEIGAGYGEFINQAAPLAKEKIVIDINPDTKKYVAENVRVLIENACDVPSLSSASVDAIFMSNFLEHLPTKDDILALFRECHRLLKANGKILILNPNIRLVGGAYWDFFDHMLPLTEKSIQEALEISGFNITTCIPAFLPYTTKSALPTHPLLIKMYLALPFFWKFLGKQCFLVAEAIK